MTRIRRSIPVMGTVATVEVCDVAHDIDAERLVDEAFEWLRAVDARFSTYRHDSEVNRLHRAEIRYNDCSADLRHVLDRCADLWAETDGYFDVYAGGGLDPSGFVKGWAVQVASERLTEAGAVKHLVDAGGDIQTRGRPADGNRWEIGIRHPWDPHSICWAIAGSDLAVATSGTYERGPHVLNPRNGQPETTLRSVTVVGRDLAVTDAYATAAVAMGGHGRAWLAGLADYESAVVMEDGTCLRSAGFPVISAPAAA
jgi:FAD:protein FMN transferase